MKVFEASELKKLYKPHPGSNGEENGQVTIIGGSSLFHGAPLFGVKIASQIVDMVFFSSPEASVGEVAAKIKSQLLSFIWVPWEEIKQYIAKSDSVLIGPGFKRYNSEQSPHGKEYHYCDEACQFTRKITRHLLEEFPEKKWVIDAGSLQVMDASWLPKNAIVTPNKKEYKALFGEIDPVQAAKDHNCIIVLKGQVSYVYSSESQVEVHGGNAGMTKGGTGDVMAGLTVGLLAKNDPFLAACSGAYVVKAAADNLFKKRGVYYNSDDLASEIPFILAQLTK
ncbi:MAG: hypothetical protein US96_C0014G0027 [Candidatus Woesebacteria bacterium GW2011_GWB1_38_5b]|uniref:ADP-dependent (S)-NAD(P)H-hydrate dehydratase n=1 Tax=Candidatus Woesebacteria bacterium GW2011_GWB1_38_5b TaxID=1618569 RepID=A0A0G0MNM8_9BACT|nr:MAG: hypothetical protein US96_C0014G0027 [Candidatus Woesebacteria bacterium GW2011_GWB1_38_5b]